jgi:hypothetical protein
MTPHGDLFDLTRNSVPTWRIINPDSEVRFDRVEDGLAERDRHNVSEHDVAVVDQSSPNGTGVNLDGHCLYSSQFLRDGVRD